MKRVLIVEDESLIAYDLQLILIRAGYHVCGTADTVEEALRLIQRGKPDIVLIDIFLNGILTGIDLGHRLAAVNQAFIYLSANFQESVLEKAKTTQPYGFLVKPFREKELLIMMEVILYRLENSNQTRLYKERALENALISLMDTPDGWKDKAEAMVSSLQTFIPFDCLSIRPEDRPEFLDDGILFIRKGYDKYKLLEKDQFLEMLNLSAKQVLDSTSNQVVEPGIYTGSKFEQMDRQHPVRKMLTGLLELNSALYFPVFTTKGKIIHFMFYSRKREGFTAEHQRLLDLVTRSLGTLIGSIMQQKNGKTATSTGHSFLPPGRAAAIKASFDGIVGNSPVMLEILDHITVSAPLDTSVLILGESGTGKERIARSIHQLSSRKSNALVTVNCASLPANLIESELFGHEKGAFTGAIEKRKGKFEAADKGTLFLDEIGEMPLEMQVKLLRVLQEREFERLGGNEIVRVDVRIIAATSRNLEKEVKEGRFRLDLYYRLCVYPIVVPPLRERGEDIILLANHFVERLAKKFNKDINGLSSEATRQLMSHDWPGNVRELENSIERSMLQNTGPFMNKILIFSHNKNPEEIPGAPPEKAIKSMDDNEREHILTVLRACNGKIGGAGGAAEYLKIPATTLHSRIKKLGLRKFT
ncbi:MAG TPA: sigma 54-interacting transcriptional regulator [Puia sp.]|jgi:DNA-binding NtrC family response regulator